jgi:hypothetical protein
MGSRSRAAHPAEAKLSTAGVAGVIVGAVGPAGVPDEANQVAGVGRGLADSESVEWPVHGLRHRPEGSTSGWFIWTGELSEDDDFFVPMHPSHLSDRVPGLVAELDAPPGSRFLLAPDHRDVWFDAALLDP